MSAPADLDDPRLENPETCGRLASPTITSWGRKCLLLTPQRIPELGELYLKPIGDGTWQVLRCHGGDMKNKRWILTEIGWTQ
jgi:hypothetical protein